jgi:hypothetical protein
MRLALAFGRTASELEDTMTAREWEEWQLFQASEPVGEERQDWRIATLLEVYINSKLKPEAERVRASSFVYLPELAQARAEAAAAKEAADLAAWARELGAKGA